MLMIWRWWWCWHIFDSKPHLLSCLPLATSAPPYWNNKSDNYVKVGANDDEDGDANRAEADDDDDEGDGDDEKDTMKK